ncbi:hypothetical protein [Anaerococcus hydrogenalis]|jgi:hypothetical protein|uniref:hypothetical protein n=1 Tax=Anaerococcus hydrogenalis TaxID=33029 RepID=UPI0028FEB148|nr:hypothetical protein [Anaerococcus hydrogenalis]MDU1315695.1 hypothetical protein [Anaerococcus hydrogenalis]
MKTNEFIKRVDELGFKAHKGVTCIDIVSDGFTVAKVSTYRVYVINSFCFVDVEWTNQDKLFNLIVEYAKTPIEDRKEETRFYLKHRYFRFYNGSSKYLGMDLVKDKPDLYSKIAYGWVKNQFTEKEIDEIEEEFDTDLKDFELVEVEE